MSTGGWFRRLVGYALRHKGSLALAFGSALVGSIVVAVTPLIARVVIDEVILTPERPLAAWLALLIAAGAVRFATSFVRRYSAGKLSLGVQHDMRTDVFTALSRLDGARQDELATGQIVSRATTDVTMVYGLLSFLPMVTGQALMFALSLVIMLTLSPPLTLVALLVVPALTWVTMRSRGKLFPAAWAAQQRAADVAGVVEAAVTGVRVVKGFGQEGRELGRLEDASTDLFAARLRNVRFNAWYGALLRTVPALGQVGVLALGGWLALRGHITLGTFLAFSSYLGQLVGPIRTVSGLLTMGQQARASVERVFEVIDSQPEVTERPDAITLPPAPAAVELDRVTFGYTRSRPVLSEVSLRVEPGETLALVGTAGSGKSTVSLLLPRFYDVQSGAVRVGGHDVREVTFASLRDSIGVVFEDSFLFSDTVRANIAYGQPDATTDRIVAAARAAEADEFIRALPDGYDTVVGEQGLTLSGGQRQRVALARALLTDPRVLLLDDATSAIDSRVEAEIHATLRTVMRGRTTLLIAHRRSTLELADRVAVLDAGRVVDVGTQDELTDRCPLFRLLLSGPGEDAEGEGTDADTITAAAWNAAAGTPAPTTAADTRIPQPRGGRGGMGGFRGSMLDQPPTPELLAKVEALPPATDTPEVSAARARDPEPDFTLRRLVAPFHRALLVAFALVGFDTLAQLALPQLIRGGVDQGVTQHLPEALTVASVAALVIVLADWAVMIGQTNVTGRTAERMLYTLRVKTFAQLQRLGLDYYERELSGRIMTRMTTDIDALTTFVQTGLLNAVVSVLSFAGVLIALLILNTGLALVLLSILPVLIATTLVFRHYSSRAYTDAREKVSVVNADLQENVAGMRVAQAFGRERHNTERFRRYSDDYRASRMRAQRYIATYFPFVEFLSTVATALVLWAGTGRVRAGELSAGALIAFILYVDMFFSPVQQLSTVFDGYQQAAVGLRRLRDLLRTETATPPAPDPRPVGRLRGEIEFDDVRFTYPGTDLPALDGLSLTIRPGETVAFVGETGAGKSTAVKLIARFYDPGAGAVRVDGMDLREVDLTAYRHRLGVVPQESYLFAGTVRDVIAYGQPDATDARVEAAARAVGAHDMIAALPGGYLHPVDERGRNLSAGQRQLLAMARAELVDPDILLLDEATAALDLASEAAVVRATDALTRTRTTVVVAHRLTSAARADRIAVLAGGRLVELGTHTDLVSAGGHYAHMWAAFLGEGSGRVPASGVAAGDIVDA